MQVDVFLARDGWDGKTRPLVLPAAQRSSTTTCQGGHWRFYGSVDSQRDLFEGIAIELHLQAAVMPLWKPIRTAAPDSFAFGQIAVGGRCPANRI